jgi:hypothetical protein
MYHLCLAEGRKLEAKDDARDARLAALEKLLLPAGEAAAQTVSLNAGE